MRPVVVYICISCHVCKLLLYTKESYQRFKDKSLRQTIQDILIVSAQADDSTLIAKSLQFVTHHWPSHDELFFFRYL